MLSEKSGVAKGYVKLAEDQSLPTKFGLYSFAAGDIHKEAQDNMLKAGWRKVIFGEGGEE